jgi:hypothetical protein
MSIPRVTAAAIVWMLLAPLAAWPQAATQPAPRVRLERTKVTIPEAHASFSIPETWLTWQHFFKLDATALATLATPATHEWDGSYGPVTDAVLPLKDCLFHIGNDGWDDKAVAFGDVQCRGYLTDLKPDALQKILADKGPSTAAAPNVSKIQVDAASDGPWTIAHIAFNLFYGDYGGTANIYFYSRPAGNKTLTLVFMLASRPASIKARDEILKSFEIDAPTTKP